MSLGKKILAVVLSALLLVVGSGAVYLFNIRSSISGASIDDKDVSVNKYLNHDIVNIALFGVDGRPDVEGNRSDTIMIASVNFKTGKTVLTSIQRDTIARIPKNSTIKKESYTKINAAYSYGGPELAIKTINENFDLNVTDYVTISFQCMIDSVNAVGGVNINIESDSILKYTNKYINDYNRLNNTHAKTLTHTGKNHLNGIQALAYSRNRYSDNDFGRTERQRKVFNQIFKKMTKLNSLKLANLITKIYPNIRTSMSTTELSTLLRGYMQMKNKKMTDQHVPYDNYYAFVNYEGSSIAPKTLVDNVTLMHQSIYGTKKAYTPSDTVIPTGKDFKFTDFLFYWLDSIKATIAYTSYNGYRINLNLIKKYFDELYPNLLLTELTALQIQKFYNDMYNEGKTGNTVKHYHANIHKALKYAVKMDLLI